MHVSDYFNEEFKGANQGAQGQSAKPPVSSASSLDKPPWMLACEEVQLSASCSLRHILNRIQHYPLPMGLGPEQMDSTVTVSTGHLRFSGTASPPCHVAPHRKVDSTDLYLDPDDAGSQLPLPSLPSPLPTLSSRDIDVDDDRMELRLPPSPLCNRCGHGERL